MQKTYWWRVAILVFSFLLGGVSYIFSNQLTFGICDDVYSTDSYKGCLDSSAQTIGEPLFLLSFSLLLVSIFLFFVNDTVFKKWLRFAIIWFVLSFIFIVLSPVYSGGWGPNFTPTKELVSIWMSSLFVIISLVKILIDSRSNRA